MNLEDAFHVAGAGNAQHAAQQKLLRMCCYYLAGRQGFSDGTNLNSFFEDPGPENLPIKFDDIDETLPDFTASDLTDMVQLLFPGRKTRGSYYTPVWLARAMCRDALIRTLGPRCETLLDDSTINMDPPETQAIYDQLRTLRVLDPACGGGVFLVEMLHLLLRLHQRVEAAGPDSRQSPSAAVVHRIIQDNLFGVDLDPNALAVTRFRLWLACRRLGGNLTPETIVRNLQPGDSLITEPLGLKADIVITNPPYGVRIAPEIRNHLFNPNDSGRQSRDSCGLFIARSLELTRENGIVSLLVGDSWRTIRSHFPLRERLLRETSIERIVELPGHVFDATVTTNVLVLRNGKAGAEHNIEATDFSAVRTDDTKLVESTLESPQSHTKRLSDIVYCYRQSECTTLPRAPIFIGSWRLRRLMTDTTLIPLGKIADIRHGLTTGNTRKFVYKSSGARGAYRAASPELILDMGETNLTQDEQWHGIDPERYDGRYLVPYDKGGASRSDSNWLPCYNVPTEYYIDWRRSSVDEMKKLPGFRHDGKEFYFRSGITFSHTGRYAPTFRLGSASVFDTAGSSLFPHEMEIELLLAVLNSKLVRYLFKTFINHTVNTAEGPLKEIPIAMPSELPAQQLCKLVGSIIRKQSRDRYYPYFQYEQLAIDELVYEQYGLQETERTEIETWFRRRYPRITADCVPDAVTPTFSPPYH